jgi:hypothetical protein
MRRRSRTSGEPVKALRRKTAPLKRRNAPKAVRRSESSVAGQETEVIRLTRELNEALERHAATSEVPRTASTSPARNGPNQGIAVGAASSAMLGALAQRWRLCATPDEFDTPPAVAEMLLLLLLLLLLRRG